MTVSNVIIQVENVVIIHFPVIMYSYVKFSPVTYTMTDNTEYKKISKN